MCLTQGMCPQPTFSSCPDHRTELLTFVVNVWCDSSNSREDGPLCTVSACPTGRPATDEGVSHVNRPGLLEVVPIPGYPPPLLLSPSVPPRAGHQNDPQSLTHRYGQCPPSQTPSSLAGEERPRAARPVPAWLQPLLFSPLPCEDCLSFFRLL